MTDKYFQPIEINNDQLLEIAVLMAELKKAGSIAENMNLGQFVTDCFLCGFYDYKKELHRMD